MLIIVDNKIPEQAKNTLKEYGNLMELQSSGITYEAISGHPDIFFHSIGNTLVVAPNTPNQYVNILKRKSVNITMGEQGTGQKYPASSAYNAVSTDSLLIHNFRYTDAVITRLGEDHDLIHVDQGYTRCNLLPLGEDHFITSDEKIKRVLDRFEKDCLYVSADGIQLEGFKHGFFGGCCGIYDKKVFVLGSLDRYIGGKEVRDYTEKLNFEIIELYDGQLFDGGSILFVETS
jgi:hypothetical protein